jgi:hypothetical protein
MTDPAIALLRESVQREVVSNLPPEQILALLRAATDREAKGGSASQVLGGRVEGPSFTLTQRSGRRATRYPGAVYGVVEAAGIGSRLVYRVDIPWHIRVVLQVWAAISVALILFGLVMAVVAIVAGEFESLLFSLWPPALALIVWRHWRQLGGRAHELDERFRTLVSAAPEIQRAAQQ